VNWSDGVFAELASMSFYSSLTTLSSSESSLLSSKLIESFSDDSTDSFFEISYSLEASSELFRFSSSFLVWRSNSSPLSSSSSSRSSRSSISSSSTNDDGSSTFLESSGFSSDSWEEPVVCC